MLVANRDNHPTYQAPLGAICRPAGAVGKNDVVMFLYQYSAPDGAKKVRNISY